MGEHGDDHDRMDAIERKRVVHAVRHHACVARADFHACHRRNVG